ncbi:GNAT family N-acetyltransferase [Streptacidiphilus fuscans]|uniref:N-acetyltransferase n=1 Tax=Streptacidiphilus fuscans TaxID=2789292 RepID=A0A931B7A7_9ACTN|nr:GNAT family N-acetyltransferase [Streptacidiphilus fuscans]MBF9068220.1 N-acetyltransferase [Streptacidiphilus fuscans]
MRAEHADAVLDVYRQGIETGNATFETEVPTWEAFDRGRLPAHRLVAVDDDPKAAATVLGWAATSAVSSRPVYAGVLEVGIYVRADARGRGVGRALLAALIASTEAAGVWTLQAGIFPENTASLALHTAAGFRVVGTRERIGRTPEGRWRDVTMLERRSRQVM